MDQNGCQFFINLAPLPFINGRHTIFGKVILIFHVPLIIFQSESAHKLQFGIHSGSLLISMNLTKCSNPDYRKSSNRTFFGAFKN